MTTLVCPLRGEKCVKCNGDTSSARGWHLVSAPSGQQASRFEFAVARAPSDVKVGSVINPSVVPRPKVEGESVHCQRCYQAISKAAKERRISDASTALLPPTSLDGIGVLSELTEWLPDGGGEWGLGADDMDADDKGVAASEVGALPHAARPGAAPKRTHGMALGGPSSDEAAKAPRLPSPAPIRRARGMPSSEPAPRRRRSPSAPRLRPDFDATQELTRQLRGHKAEISELKELVAEQKETIDAQDGFIRGVRSGADLADLGRTLQVCDIGTVRNACAVALQMLPRFG
jgi:hypothetical protein